MLSHPEQVDINHEGRYRRRGIAACVLLIHQKFLKNFLCEALISNSSIVLEELRVVLGQEGLEGSKMSGYAPAVDADDLAHVVALVDIHGIGGEQ